MKTWAAAFVLGALSLACAESEQGCDDCNGGTGGTGGALSLSAESSPIVYGSFDPLGTFYSLINLPEPQHVNDNYDFFPLSLSPHRTRLLQATSDDTGAPRAEVQVFALAPDGDLLGKFPTPGQVVGWVDESTVLFEELDGVVTRDLSGSERSRITLPAWVNRESTGYFTVRSVDGGVLAFSVTSSERAGPIVLMLDATTGAELGDWSLPERGDPLWAGNGQLIVTTTDGFFSIKPGDAALSGPFPLPFQPCAPRAWTTRSRIELGELIQAGDTAYCGNSWLVDTDGTNLERRDAPSPVAISPDGRKLLLLDDQGLSTSNPDGTGVARLAGTAMAHDPVW